MKTLLTLTLYLLGFILIAHSEETIRGTSQSDITLQKQNEAVSETRNLGLILFSIANSNKGIQPATLEELVSSGQIKDPNFKTLISKYFYFPSDTAWLKNPDDRIILIRHLPEGVVVYRFKNSAEFIKIEH